LELYIAHILSLAHFYIDHYYYYYYYYCCNGDSDYVFDDGNVKGAHKPAAGLFDFAEVYNLFRWIYGQAIKVFKLMMG